MYKRITTLIILMSLGACWSNSMRMAELPLEIDVERIPGNWIAFEAEYLPGWRAIIAYAVIISMAPSLDRSYIYLDYLQYSDEATAINTYTGYSEHAFRVHLSDSIWFDPLGVDLTTITADIYQFQCRKFTIGRDLQIDRELCNYAARYNNCIIGISAHIRENLFTLEDFIEMLSTYIDPELASLEECNL